MNFLVDAQLPRGLAAQFNSFGHDALHTLNLPQGNRTSDTELLKIALEEKRALITKDADFVNSYILQQAPSQLLLVATGNIANRELLNLFRLRLPEIVSAFETHSFLEIDRTGLTKHG